MHIFFSGIGGSGLSSLAHLCLDLGYQVSGSDTNFSSIIKNLQKRKITFLNSQDTKTFFDFIKKYPIDLFIHSSAIKNNQEIEVCKQQNIPFKKRDYLINFILKEKNLKLLAIAGTHGKTTTSSLLSYLFFSLNIPVTQVIGTTFNWGNSGSYQKNSKYFILEADEYDRHFLSYNPDYSLISSLDYDHPDIYPTQLDYNLAFLEFISQSKNLIAYYKDIKNLNLIASLKKQKTSNQKLILLNDQKITQKINLLGKIYNENANLVFHLFSELFGNISKSKIINILNSFPGTSRRLELISKNIYTDYAHHPNEIKATLKILKNKNKEIVCIYQPHQNYRQHSILDLYNQSFDDCQKVFLLPTYLSRENPVLKILSQEEIAKKIKHSNLEIVNLDSKLEDNLNKIIKNDCLIIFMGAGDIDNFARNWINKLN